MISTERVADVFVQVADTLVAPFDLVDFLHELTDLAADLTGADAVGLVLADHRGALRFMAASNDAGMALELFQIQAEEGPCLDCFRTATPVLEVDLGTAEDRWPRFAPRARSAGYQWVHAFPMRLRDQAIGALNLFGGGAGAPDPEESRVIQALADIATVAILQQRALARAEVVTEQLQGVLNSRILIEQAKGALAQRESITPDEAFARMRQIARREQRHLDQVAAEVLGVT